MHFGMSEAAAGTIRPLAAEGAPRAIWPAGRGWCRYCSPHADRCSGRLLWSGRSGSGASIESVGALRADQIWSAADGQAGASPAGASVRVGWVRGQFGIRCRV